MPGLLKKQSGGKQQSSNISLHPPQDLQKPIELFYYFCMTFYFLIKYLNSLFIWCNVLQAECMKHVLWVTSDTLATKGTTKSNLDVQLSTIHRLDIIQWVYFASWK